ncbi:MAG: hypothetical protein HYX29_07180 [Solirubrobacterales bacterium]|nr:hypothetical protein [Solirubrobacterales bacterium]
MNDETREPQEHQISFRNARKALLEKISQLLDLEPGWDTYEATPIDHGSARAAYDFAVEALRRGLPQPHIVPVPDGGIQLEWSQNRFDLEIEFEPHSNIPVFIGNDRVTGRRFDGDQRADFIVLEMALDRLNFSLD